MSDPGGDWYIKVDVGTPVTQGDIIFNCPVLTWKPEPLSNGALENSVLGQQIDAVVMSQACDLEHGKVKHVVLCPHVPLSRYKENWVEQATAHGHKTNTDAWRSHFKALLSGSMWNYSVLNRFENGDVVMEPRVVNFHNIFTIPRVVLESVPQGPRPRLLPPYREHLSQAFARYFMRVGLPTPVSEK